MYLLETTREMTLDRPGPLHAAAPNAGRWQLFGQPHASRE